MSTDSSIGNYVRSRISTDYLIGKYTGFSIARTSLFFVGFTIRTLFADYSYTSYYSRREAALFYQTPASTGIRYFFPLEIYQGLKNRQASGTTTFLAFSTIYPTSFIYYYSGKPDYARAAPVQRTEKNDKKKSGSPRTVTSFFRFFFKLF